MSSSKSRVDKDLYLKLLVQRLFRVLGYHTELELPLLVSSYRGKYARPEISDVDVLGMRFESDFRRSTLVAECKSGETKAAEQLLKLWGVMVYFDADRGYLVKERIAENAREIARGRKIATLDEEELILLLSNLSYYEHSLMEEEVALYNAQRRAERLVKDRHSTALFTYISREYWNREHWENIHNVMYFLGRLSTTAESTVFEDRYVVIRLLSLLNLSVLALCSDVLSSRLSDIGRSVEMAIFGGARARRERERLHDLFAQAGHIASTTLAAIDPPFLEALKEVVAFLVRSPDHASRTPLFLQRITGEIYLHRPSFELISIEAQFSQETRKLAKDVCEFGLKGAGFSAPQDFIGDVLKL